ncbi:MAG: lipoprotein-releasing ABC transporter permease subunit [Alphaproteobacteria bacterium]
MMFTRLDFQIALRYLRAKRKEGFISVIAWFSLIGVMLGVATLIIVLSVMNGFRADLLERIIGINGHVNIVKRDQSPIKDYDAIIDQLQGIDQISLAMPVIEGQALASVNGRAQGIMIRGYRGDDFAARNLLQASVMRKQFYDGFINGDGALAGYRMLSNLGLSQASNIKLLSPKLQNTIFGSVPKAMSINIVGGFNLGMYEYDENFIFLNLDKAMQFFDMNEAASRIEIIGKDPEQAQALARSIQALLPSTYAAIPWQRVNGSFFTALQVERNVMFIILTLIILVAAFNIVSSQIMLVKDKARGIAILRSMGASQGMIYRIFLLSGSAVGVIGASLGALLGILFASNINAIRGFIENLSGVEVFAAEIYFLSNLPSKINPSEVILVVAIALILSLLASIYPAWRAAKTDPVEVLRYG